MHSDEDISPDRSRMESTRSEETKKKIAASINATKERRKNQDVYAVEFKVIESRLSPEDLWKLDRIFDESKWIRNSLIRLDDINVVAMCRETIWQPCWSHGNTAI